MKKLFLHLKNGLIIGFLVVACICIPTFAGHKARVSAQTAAYLKRKKVPVELQKKLDAYFSLPAIQTLLAQLYNVQNDEEIAPIAHALQKRGFAFLGGKFHVFTHKLFPGYVFKMAMPLLQRTEALNAGRIEYADYLREIIKRKKLKIKIAQKWGYHFPQHKKNLRPGTMKLPLPQIFVVARYMNLKGASKTLTPELKKDVEILSREGNYLDDHDDNVVMLKGYAIITDTEPHTKESLNALYFGTSKPAQEIEEKPIEQNQNITNLWNAIVPHLDPQLWREVVFGE